MINLKQRLHELALNTINEKTVDWTGFVKLGPEERQIQYVSCFSNCLSTRSNCLSPTLIANIIETDGIPLAPLR